MLNTDLLTEVIFYIHKEQESLLLEYFKPLTNVTGWIYVFYEKEYNLLQQSGKNIITTIKSKVNRIG